MTPEPLTSTIREKRIENTPNRFSGRFDRMVDDSSSLDDDPDHVLLTQIKRTIPL